MLNNNEIDWKTEFPRIGNRNSIHKVGTLPIIVYKCQQGEECAVHWITPDKVVCVFVQFQVWQTQRLSPSTVPIKVIDNFSDQNIFQRHLLTVPWEVNKAATFVYCDFAVDWKF